MMGKLGTGNIEIGNTSTLATLNHDRVLIIDKAILIHGGASLNHLGKKCFTCSSMDKSHSPDIVAKM